MFLTKVICDKLSEKENEIMNDYDCDVKSCVKIGAIGFAEGIIDGVIIVSALAIVTSVGNAILTKKK